MFVVKIGPELLAVVKVKATIRGKNDTKRRDNYLNTPYMCFFYYFDLHRKSFISFGKSHLTSWAIRLQVGQSTSVDTFYPVVLC